MADPEKPGRTPRRDDLPGEGASRGTTRMEAFADAVFAIAFTLPVVEIEMPEAGAPIGEQLLELWPSYLGYALASLAIGIYWVHHHFSGAIYRTVGHWFNMATVLFLGAIGFIAFPARVFAEHIADADLEARGSAAVAFTLTLSATALTWWIKWNTGRRLGHIDERLEPAYVARLNHRYNVATGLMLVAAAVVFLSWQVGLALASAVTLFFMLAPPTPVYRTTAPVVEGEEASG